MRMRLIALIALVFVCGGCQHGASSLPNPAPPTSGGPVLPLILQNPEFQEHWLRIATGAAGSGATIVGPDGAVWSVGSGSLTRLDYSRHFHTFTPARPPYFSMAVGPDGNFWFPYRTTIVRMTLQGSEAIFFTTGEGSGITLGPDGNMWFTETGAGIIGRITMKGKVTEFNGANEPYDITPGPDGDLYYTGALISGRNVVGRVAMSGKISEQTLSSTGLGLATTGPDGKVYLLDGAPSTSVTAQFAVVSSGFRVFEQPVPMPHKFAPLTVFVGPDGNIWLGGELHTPHGLRASFLIYDRASGQFSTQPITEPSGYPKIQFQHIVTAPDGNIWWISNDEFILVYHVLKPAPAAFTFSGTGQQQTLTVAETHYLGPWSVSTTNAKVVTVQPGTSSNSFVVTSVGAGHANVRIDDQHLNTTYVPVTVQ
jgi:virginiamycin B lyase